MGSNNRKTGQKIIKAAILHDVYCGNRATEEPPAIQQPLRLRRFPRVPVWARMVSLMVGLSLAGFATHAVFQHGSGVAPQGGKEDAGYATFGWNQEMALLFAEATAGLRRFSVAYPLDRVEIPYRRGAVSLLDEELPTGSGLLDAAGYQLLNEQPGMTVANLFGLGVRTIIIDAGHGGRDPGAIGPTGLKEKDITLKIARLLYNRLVDEPGISVVMTRDSDITLSLKQRVEYARQYDADLLVSIHLNTIPGSPLTVVETYYFGPPVDEQSVDVARKENHHSGYAVAEFNELIAGLGDTLKQQESRKLAAYIQKSVYGALSRDNRSIIDVGIRTAPFVLLLGAEVPSVLAEVTCISNTEEEARLAKPAYRDKIAGALERGILSYMNQLRQQDRRQPEDGSTIHAES